MRKLFVSVLLLVATALFSFGTPAMAAGNPAEGAKVFAGNCAACHVGGNNVINPAKTLKKEDLVKYGKYSEEAIYYQAMNGAGAMPNFKRLGETNLRNVAAYVYEQATKGW